MSPGLSSACCIPVPAPRYPCIGIHNGCWEGCVYVVDRAFVCVCIGREEWVRVNGIMYGVWVLTVLWYVDATVLLLFLDI